MKKIILDNGIAILEGDSHLGPWVRQCGHLDHDGLIEVLAGYIPPGTWAIDAGASIGDHTFGYLKRLPVLAGVAAFEPNPEAFACLVHNCPLALCFNFALGAHPRSAPYFVSNPNYGASFIDEYRTGLGDFHVPIMPLDLFKFPARVGFIKVDIEGFESKFLLGASDTIRRDRPIMCLEVNRGALEKNGSSPEKLISELHAFGYTTQPVPGTKEDPLQWDVLALPK